MNNDISQSISKIIYSSEIERALIQCKKKDFSLFKRVQNINHYSVTHNNYRIADVFCFHNISKSAEPRLGKSRHTATAPFAGLAGCLAGLLFATNHKALGQTGISRRMTATSATPPAGIDFSLSS